MTPNDSNKTPYWFPAKRYGWGWGIPSRKEGWLVLLAYFAALAAAILIVPPDESILGFLGVVIAETLVLLAICKAKGEPPRWRWGDDD